MELPIEPRHLGADGRGGKTPLTPAVRERLIDARLIEQMPWIEVGKLYCELTGESRDWRAVRGALMSEAPMRLVPQRVSSHVRQAIEGLMDRVDLMKLLMYAVTARFHEWSMLHDRMILCELDAEGGEARPRKFSRDERARMDTLWNELMGFFMRGLDLMRQMNAGNSAVLDVFVHPPPAEVADGTVTINPGVVKSQVLEEFRTTTQRLMEGIMERHKAAGTGYFRPIEASVLDVEESDESDE